MAGRREAGSSIWSAAAVAVLLALGWFVWSFLAGMAEERAAAGKRLQESAGVRGIP